jgi:hypothetical protein
MKGDAIGTALSAPGTRRAAYTDGRFSPTPWLVPANLAQSWTFPARKARGHVLLLMAVLWIGAAVTQFAGSTNRTLVGPLKAADFVHFYTLGTLVRTGRSDLLYDYAGQHAVQGELVPEAADLVYPTVYPPQTAILFAPFSLFAYQTAALLWVALTIFCYSVIVRAAWMPVSSQLPDALFLGAAAAAFPPFWQLVIHGQSTIIVLIAFVLGWLALERRRDFLAGCAFGLIAMKPQFGLGLAVVVLARREWRIALGAVVSITAQLLIVYLLLDAAVWQGFLRMAQLAADHSDLLQAKPYQTHSLRTIARLAPDSIETPLWLGASASALWLAARVWCLDAPLRLRLSAVILASVLVNPHVIVYDATILVLPLIWVSAAVHHVPRADSASWYWLGIYGLFVTLLAPTAAIIGVQLSVLLMVGVLVQAHGIARECSRDRTPLHAFPPRTM